MVNDDLKVFEALQSEATAAAEASDAAFMEATAAWDAVLDIEREQDDATDCLGRLLDSLRKVGCLNMNADGTNTRLVHAMREIQTEANREAMRAIDACSKRRTATGLLHAALERAGRAANVARLAFEAAEAKRRSHNIAATDELKKQRDALDSVIKSRQSVMANSDKAAAEVLSRFSEDAAAAWKSAGDVGLLVDALPSIEADAMALAAQAEEEISAIVAKAESP